jgi:hypothetical protein
MESSLFGKGTSFLEREAGDVGDWKKGAEKLAFSLPDLIQCRDRISIQRGDAKIQPGLLGPVIVYIYGVLLIPYKQ